MITPMESQYDVRMAGKLLLFYICSFHVLSHLLLIYICKLHWIICHLCGGVIVLELYPTSEVGTPESESVSNSGCTRHLSVGKLLMIYI